MHMMSTLQNTSSNNKPMAKMGTKISVAMATVIVPIGHQAYWLHL